MRAGLFVASAGGVEHERPDRFHRGRADGCADGRAPGRVRPRGRGVRRECRGDAAARRVRRDRGGLGARGGRRRRNRLRVPAVAGDLEERRARARRHRRGRGTPHLRRNVHDRHRRRQGDRLRTRRAWRHRARRPGQRRAARCARGQAVDHGRGRPRGVRAYATAVRRHRRQGLLCRRGAGTRADHEAREQHDVGGGNGGRPWRPR